MKSLEKIKEIFKKHYCSVESAITYDGCTTTRIIKVDNNRYLVIMNNGNIEEIHPLKEVA